MWKKSTTLSTCKRNKHKHFSFVKLSYVNTVVPIYTVHTDDNRNRISLWYSYYLSEGEGRGWLFKGDAYLLFWPRGWALIRGRALIRAWALSRRNMVYMKRNWLETYLMTGIFTWLYILTQTVTTLVTCLSISLPSVNSPPPPPLLLPPCLPACLFASKQTVNIHWVDIESLV